MNNRILQLFVIYCAIIATMALFDFKRHIEIKRAWYEFVTFSDAYSKKYPWWESLPPAMEYEDRR